MLAPPMFPLTVFLGSDFIKLSNFPFLLWGIMICILSSPVTKYDYRINKKPLILVLIIIANRIMTPRKAYIQYEGSTSEPSS